MMEDDHLRLKYFDMCGMLEKRMAKAGLCDYNFSKRDKTLTHSERKLLSTVARDLLHNVVPRLVPLDGETMTLTY